MLKLIMGNKWAILLILEFVAWSATFCMFYARYKMKSQIWFKAATIALILTGVVPQVLLGIVNFAAVGEIDLFTVVIVILIMYGLTIGKQHVKKLDAWAMKKFSGQDKQHDVEKK